MYSFTLFFHLTNSLPLLGSSISLTYTSQSLHSLKMTKLSQTIIFFHPFRYTTLHNPCHIFHMCFDCSHRPILSHHMLFSTCFTQCIAQCPFFMVNLPLIFFVCGIVCSNSGILCKHHLDNMNLGNYWSYLFHHQLCVSLLQHYINSNFLLLLFFSCAL